jgi:hypothetical protein
MRLSLEHSLLFLKQQIDDPAAEDVVAGLAAMTPSGFGFIRRRQADTHVRDREVLS